MKFFVLRKCAVLRNPAGKSLAPGALGGFSWVQNVIASLSLAPIFPPASFGRNEQKRSMLSIVTLRPFLGDWRRKMAAFVDAIAAKTKKREAGTEDAAY